MNNTRRKLIDEVLKDLENLKNELSNISGRVDEIRDEEQDYLDNMPEGIQMSDKGSRAEEVIALLDDAVAEFDSFDFEAITAPLEEAKE